MSAAGQDPCADPGRAPAGRGIVVNAHPNVSRDDFDALKALLHNAARHGPASQNRTGVANFEAHLRGRVAWVEAVNPQRGAKLRVLLEAIRWE